MGALFGGGGGGGGKGYVAPLQKYWGAAPPSLPPPLPKPMLHIPTLCNSYTEVCPSVRGDNPRALARGLSPVQADKPL